MMSRRSRLASHPLTWLLLAATTVLAIVLTLGHIILTIQNISRLERMLPTLQEYSACWIYFLSALLFITFYSMGER